MKVVAIGGSPRLSGRTNYLIDRMLTVLKSRGIETEKIVLNQYKISPCQPHDGCAQAKECLQKDDGNWIMDKWVKADAVIVASPVYFGTISAQIKVFMDRTFFLFHHRKSLNARCAAAIAVDGRGGSDEASEELMKFFRPGNLQVFVLKGHAGPPEAKPEQQIELIEKAEVIGKQMADILLKQTKQRK